MTRFSALLLVYPPSRHWHGLPSPLSPSTPLRAPLCHHFILISSHGHLLLIIVSPYTAQFDIPQLVTWRMSMFRYPTLSLKRSSSYHGCQPRSVIAPTFISSIGSSRLCKFSGSGESLTSENSSSVCGTSQTEIFMVELIGYDNVELRVNIREGTKEVICQELSSMVLLPVPVLLSSL